MPKASTRDRLLAYRIARGWTQAETAKRAEVSPTTIAHLETGANDSPRRITLMRLAKAFGVSLEEFLGQAPPGQGDLFSQEEYRAMEQNAREARVYQEAGGEIKALSDEGNRALLEQVRDGDVEGLEREANEAESLYRRAVRLRGTDHELTGSLAGSLATVLAALALTRGGELEDVKAVVLRALAAQDPAHTEMAADSA